MKMGRQTELGIETELVKNLWRFGKTNALLPFVIKLKANERLRMIPLGFFIGCDSRHLLFKKDEYGVP